MAALHGHAEGIGMTLIDFLVAAMVQYERSRPRSMTLADRVVALVQKGKTDGETAAILGTSNVYVGRLRRAAGLPPNRPNSH